MIKSTILVALVALLAPNGARPQEVPDCSCSPRAFQFVISLGLDPNCENNDIEDNTGIQSASTICFVEAGNPPDPPVNGIIEEGEEIKEEVMIAEELQNPEFEVSNVTAFIFKEFDQSRNMVSEISQNYGSTPLQNGDPINLFSVSSLLSPSSSLEDQIGKVPYSAEIRLFGYNIEGQLISNIIRWSYNMNCGSDPIQTADTIGWITIVSCDCCIRMIHLLDMYNKPHI